MTVDDGGDKELAKLLAEQRQECKKNINGALKVGRNAATRCGSNSMLYLPFQLSPS